MTVTRSAFLKTLGAALAAATLDPSELLAALPEADPSDPGDAFGGVFSAELFAPYVGLSFRASTRAGRPWQGDLVLDAVQSIPSTGSEQFTLSFKSYDAVRLPAGMISISNPSFGRTRVFIQPAGEDENLRFTRYRAEFNLLKP